MPAPCSDCGDDAIFHGLTYYSILIDEFFASLFGPEKVSVAKKPSKIGLMIDSFGRWFTPHMLDLFIATGLASSLIEPDDDTQLLALMIWQEAKKRGITVEEFRLLGLPRNMFLATYPSGKRLAFEGIPLPPADVARVSWMDNKAILKREFTRLGLPVAKGGSASTLYGAKKVFKDLTPPVIVKPYSGSGSRHTVLHITNEEELVKAFRIASRVAPRSVVEEELVGLVYRITVVNGIYEAALRRFPPSVLGDGAHTIEELVSEENKHPLRSGPYFTKIKLGDAAELELKRQALTTQSVPAPGTIVTLHQKINWSVGGTTEDATDDVHPDNKALFEEIARVLGATIVGIDFIIGDLGRSWKEQERCGVLECNSMPFFENHSIVFRGTSRNIAEKVWDMSPS